MKIGDLMSASVRGFVAGVRVSAFAAPQLGALVRVPQKDWDLYGIIYNIGIGDDGLVRRTLTGDNLPPSVRADMRERRLVPVEMYVQAVGYEQAGRIRHLLPPRPPLGFDEVYLCSAAEKKRFAPGGRWGYLRHLAENRELPLGDVLAAHLQIMAAAQENPADWLTAAVDEVVRLLRDDANRLLPALSALNELF